MPLKLTVGLSKKVGLPKWDDATPRQRRDGMAWKSPDERYNDGGAFKLTGFGHAYEGTVLSWHRGALDVALGASSRVAVRLAPSAAERPAASAFPGNQEFRSEAMRDINPRVYEIAIDFD